MILAFGGAACLLPIIYNVSLAYQDAFHSGFSYSGQVPALGLLSNANAILFIALGFMIGYPIASASVGVLRGLWWNDLVALKGACPNCGEEVFAFVRSDQSNKSPHQTECHVCESSLEFRTKVESISRHGRQWVHGRIYLRGRNQRRRWM